MTFNQKKYSLHLFWPLFLIDQLDDSEKNILLKDFLKWNELSFYLKIILNSSTLHTNKIFNKLQNLWTAQCTITQVSPVPNHLYTKTKHIF